MLRYKRDIDEQNFNPIRVTVHKDLLEEMRNKARELYWPRAMGKTVAMNTFFGIDLATSSAISANQMVFMDDKGRIKVLDWEKKDMCYECQTEGSEAKTPMEKRLVEELNRIRDNHLGAPTERFIELARESGKNEHLQNYTRQLEQELHQTRQELARAVEQARYSDNETQKANNRARSWENSYYTIERRYENYKAKHAPKKNAKKAQGSK